MAGQFTSAHWTSDEIAKATGGVWLNRTADWTAKGVTLCDSKGRFGIDPGDVVIVPDSDAWGRWWERDLKPDLIQIREQGALAVVMSALPAETPTDLPVLKVSATRKALLRMANYARERVKDAVIAITGSVGKTTTSAFLRSVLSNHGRVFTGPDHWNGRLGVPLSMTLIPPDIDYVVQECGMKRPNSIRRKARLLRPDVAIITHIAHAHTEFHSSLESVARTKATLFEFLPEHGFAIINRDTNHYEILRAAAGAHQMLTYGRHEQADVRLLSCSCGPRGSEVEAGVLGARVSYFVGTPGVHQALNSLAVLATTTALGFHIEQVAAAMGSLTPAPMRSNVVEVKLPNGRLTIIDDSYNANPASMRAAMELLRLIPTAPGGRRIAVLGAMAELGSDSKRHHEELAVAVSDADPDLVITLGDDMKSLRSALPLDILGPHLQERKELKRVVLRSVQAGDVVVIKGSALWGMCKIVKALRTLETQSTGS